MLIRKPADIPSSEITPEDVYLNRRQFVQQAGQAAAAAALVPSALSACQQGESVELAENVGSRVATGPELQDAVTPFEDATTYNNYYEFGTDKADPARNSGRFKPQPWTVKIEGNCQKPGTFDVATLAPKNEVEERVYRMRCVEAWSMVIPWNGVPLRKIIERAQPTANAKFVAFETVMRPAEMPGQRVPVLDWPYVEGLRMDEAMNDLAILATGMYGKDLPNQNGAPLRLVTPWKYGFKGIKSIVKIRFVEAMPPTTWNIMAANEYGFYANVNPTVNHPRWSQARERRITGGGLLARLGREQETLMFNGYGDKVAQMYAGMDLRKFY